MKLAKECASMMEIREAIDYIDEEIVKLIALRSSYVQKASVFKKDENAVKDPSRVAQVLASKKALAERLGASPELIEILYKEMVSFFINEEMQTWKKLD